MDFVSNLYLSELIARVWHGPCAASVSRIAFDAEGPGKLIRSCLFVLSSGRDY